VRVLGYTQREDRQEVESRLLPGETAAFDPYLGWLAIPESPIADRQVSGANQPVAPSIPSLQPPANDAPAVKQPPLSERLTNAPPVDAGSGSTDSASEQQKKLRSILEDAFKKAEESREPK
jgi:hypothetical protein